ncbi:hypothetical protein OWV82_024340 [Melia azedarach]|uniref:Uncharacterized protein n=1 Tax=Melia azedarach TaxID=155640 RepID=A0ACC1WPP7_MELAZ|nr:hypothetical protein OWV82_024340 [Melia azedarach]
MFTNRMNEMLAGTILRYSDIDPGPGTSEDVKNEALMGLKVYGKGVNQNKLMTRRLFCTRRFLNTYRTERHWMKKLKGSLADEVSPGGEESTMGETSEQKSVILDPFPVRMEEPFEPVVIEDTYAKWCMSDNREAEISSLQNRKEFGEFRQTMREFATILRGITSSSQNQGNGNKGQNMSALSEFKRLNPPTFNGRCSPLIAEEWVEQTN